MMQIRATESIGEGDLVSLATGPDGATVLLRWRYGCEAIGVAARTIREDDVIEYSPGKSSDDILVKGSAGPAHNRIVTIKAACDLKAEDLVCLRLLPDGNLLIDKWEYGQEAVGIAARDIRHNETVSFCEGESTDDVHVKPH